MADAFVVRRERNLERKKKQSLSVTMSKINRYEKRDLMNGK